MKWAKFGVFTWLINTGAWFAFLVAAIFLVVFIFIAERKTIMRYLRDEEVV